MRQTECRLSGIQVIGSEEPDEGNLQVRICGGGQLGNHCLYPEVDRAGLLASMWAWQILRVVLFDSARQLSSSLVAFSKEFRFMEINGCEFCLPVFFHSYFLFDGHTEETENATLTFIKYENRIYAVTCRHVIHHLNSKRNKLNDQWYTLSISLDQVILQLSDIDHADPSKRKDIFRKLTCSFDREDVDIVIAPIDSHWGLIKSKKNKKAIDLDSWSIMNWSKFKMGTAFGYPTEHKELQGDKVAAPCINVCAELVSNVSITARQLTLFSTLQNPHGYFFSGLSGGVIVLSSEDSHVPAGIIYEGQPGSSKDFKDKQSNGQAFFSGNDILIKGFIISPSVFSEWLQRAGFS